MKNATGASGPLNHSNLWFSIRFTRLTKESSPIKFQTFNLEKKNEIFNENHHKGLENCK